MGNMAELEIKEFKNIVEMIFINIYLFFLCSTKSLAGYNISMSIVILLTVLFCIRKKNSLVFFPSIFFFSYIIFFGGLLVASYLIGQENSIKTAVKLFSYTSPMWVLFFALQGKKIMSSILWGMLFGTNILNVIVIYELFSLPIKERIHGSFASPNNFAMVLEAILPFLVVQIRSLISKNKKYKNIREKIIFYSSLITTALGIFGLFLSASRGGIAGFLLGGMITIFMYYRFSSIVWNKKKVFKGIGALILSIIVIVSGGTLVFKRKYDPERLLLWRAAYQMWLDHPLYGVGFDQWNAVYRQHYISPTAKEPTLTLPHNNLANFFSCTGLIGGIGYLVFMGTSLIFLFRIMKVSNYAYAMLWVWISFSVHGMVDNSLFARYNTRLFFAMWGVTLADYVNIKRKGLSHLKVCKDFLSTNAPYWTIFEDDIHLSNEFLDAYPRIESFMNSQIEPSVLLLRRNNGKGKVVYPLGRNHHVLHMLAGTMACGYIINRKAAENLVKALIPVRIEYDAWAIYQQLGYIKLYSTDFNYVELNPTMSSNSIIDQMEKRYDDSCQFPKKIKDGNVKALYNQNSPSQKIILQLKRVVRHLQELYYDEYRH